MNRFINWLKALFNTGMDKVENPEMMLDQARRDMTAALQSNREKAIQAVTQRNQLQKMMDENRAKSISLQQQAEVALKQGNRDVALQLIREKQNVDATVAQIEPSFNQATATVESVKVAMRQQEDEVKKKTAEALALKASWKQAQIQSSIAKALDGLNFDAQFETSSFGAARDRITLAQSEAAARTEMQGESIQGKIMSMQSAVKDSNAEAELQKLEATLGMGAASTISTVNTTPVEQHQSIGGTIPTTIDPVTGQPIAEKGEAEKALEELENRLKPQN